MESTTTTPTKTAAATAQATPTDVPNGALAGNVGENLPQTGQVGADQSLSTPEMSSSNGNHTNVAAPDAPRRKSSNELQTGDAALNNVNNPISDIKQLSFAFDCEPEYAECLYTLYKKLDTASIKRSRVNDSQFDFTCKLGKILEDYLPTEKTHNKPIAVKVDYMRLCGISDNNAADPSDSESIGTIKDVGFEFDGKNFTVNLYEALKRQNIDEFVDESTGALKMNVDFVLNTGLAFSVNNTLVIYFYLDAKTQENVKNLIYLQPIAIDAADKGPLVLKFVLKKGLIIRSDNEQLKFNISYAETSNVKPSAQNDVIFKVKNANTPEYSIINFRKGTVAKIKGKFIILPRKCSMDKNLYFQATNNADFLKGLDKNHATIAGICAVEVTGRYKFEFVPVQKFKKFSTKVGINSNLYGNVGNDLKTIAIKYRHNNKILKSFRELAGGDERVFTLLDCWGDNLRDLDTVLENLKKYDGPATIQDLKLAFPDTMLNTVPISVVVQENLNKLRSFAGISPEASIVNTEEFKNAPTPRASKHKLNEKATKPVACKKLKY